MAVVDYIDLVDDEDSVEDGHVEEDDDNVAQAKKAAEAAASLSIAEHTATATTSSLMVEEAKQPEYQEIPVASDAAEEAMQFGNHGLIAEADCVGKPMQNIIEASDFEGHQEMSQDIVIVPPSTQDKEKQSNTSAAECNKQFSIVHTMGMHPIVQDSGFNVMGNTGNGEVVMCKYQGFSKPSQGDTMHCEALSGGSEGSLVQGCTEGAHGDTSLCISHRSSLHKVCCAVTSCTSARRTSSEGRTKHCVKYGVGKRCKYDGCWKGAQGKTDFCIAHGGGRRCKCEGCGKSAQGKTDFCIAHGGGRRCKFEGCGKSAQWKNNYCAEHGAGRHYKMCKHEHGCRKYARGKTDFCVAHGGGRRCKFEGCGKSVPWRSDYCIEHGGGRCKFLGCSASTLCRTDLCSMHTKAILSSNNSAHEMPKRQAEKEEACKRRNPCSVIGGGAQKRKNTSCYVDNSTSFNVAEMGEERARASVCLDNVLKAKGWGCTSRRSSSKDQK